MGPGGSRYNYSAQCAFLHRNQRIIACLGFPGGTSVIESACQCSRTRRYGFDPWVQEDPLEEGMATHSSILAWRIPWTESHVSLVGYNP